MIPLPCWRKLFGDHSVDARSIVTEDGDYGQVLLSRWPFAEPPKISDVSIRNVNRAALLPRAYCPVMGRLRS
jgi:hypothetical protein